MADVQADPVEETPFARRTLKSLRRLRDRPYTGHTGGYDAQAIQIVERERLKRGLELSDSILAGSTAGGVLTGSYPNPSFAVDMATQAELNTEATTRAADDLLRSLITRSINAQVGTAYTIVLADTDNVVTVSNAAAITVTIPTNATTAFVIGRELDIICLSATGATIVGAGGVTVHGAGLALAQWERAKLIKIATNQWNVNLMN